MARCAAAMVPCNGGWRYDMKTPSFQVKDQREKLHQGYTKRSFKDRIRRLGYNLRNVHLPIESEVEQQDVENYHNKLQLIVHEKMVENSILLIEDNAEQSTDKILSRKTKKKVLPKAVRRCSRFLGSETITAMEKANKRAAVKSLEEVRSGHTGGIYFVLVQQLARIWRQTVLRFDIWLMSNALGSHSYYSITPMDEHECTYCLHFGCMRSISSSCPRILSIGSHLQITW